MMLQGKGEELLENNDVTKVHNCMDTEDLKNTFKISPTSVPSPCRWGRVGVGVGVDKKQSGPLSPSPC